MLDPATVSRYSAGLALLSAWLSMVSGRPSVAQLVELQARPLVGWLEQFVEEKYSEGELRSTVVDCILGLLKEAWWLRHSLTPIWRLLGNWQLREPMECRRPMPPVVLLSMITVAITWGMPRFAVGLWTAFHGLLRPGELFSMVRGSVIFCSSLGYSGSQAAGAVLAIPFPKTRKYGPRRQHVMVLDWDLVAIMEVIFGHLDPAENLMPYTDATARSRFAKILERIGIPGHMYSWASLRAGGATFDYLSGTPVAAIKFRGRWAAEKTLEHYIQECTAALDMAALPSLIQRRCQALSRFAPALLNGLLHGNSCNKNTG